MSGGSSPALGQKKDSKRRGSVCLSTQKVHLRRPRLRRRSGGEGAEVTLPAYEAMQSGLVLRDKLCSILTSGVSTRSCERVVPAMAESCGASKSALSRELAAASGGRKHVLRVAQGASENQTVARGLLESLA